MDFKINFKLIGVLAVTSLFSCKKEDNPVIPPTPAPQKPKVLVPLRIGNSWSFRITTFDTTGRIVWTDTARYFIRLDTLIDGKLWYLQGYGGASLGQLGFRNDSIGFYQTNFAGANWHYRFPAQKGQYSWNYIVESIDSVISTPIGVLHCYVYWYDWFGHHGREIFAPGIGWVHTDNLGRTWSGTVWLAQTKDLVAVTIDSTTNIPTEPSPTKNTRRQRHITRPTTALPFVERE